MSGWGGVAFLLLFFIGLIMLLIVIPMLLSPSPQTLKHFVMDHLVWLLFGGTIVLLIWENA